MKITAEMGRQCVPLCPPEYQVDKVAELPNAQFTSFLLQSLNCYQFIEENRVEPHQGDGFDHCLLVLADGRTDGVLVKCGGKGRARYAAYVAGARDMVQARLDRAAEYIIRQGAEHTASGYWCIYHEELTEQAMRPTM